jgi:dGTPase
MQLNFEYFRSNRWPEFFLEAFDQEEQKKIRSEFVVGNLHRTNLARLRRHVFDKAISTTIEKYMDAYPTIMVGGYDGNILDLLDATDPTFRMIYGAKNLGRKQVYTDVKKIEMEIGCYAIFDILLTELCSAALNQAAVINDKANEVTLSWKSGHVLHLLGDHAPTVENAPPGGWSYYQCLRRVIDYVTGMTDNYATYISRQLRGMAFAGVQRP